MKSWFRIGQTVTAATGPRVADISTRIGSRLARDRLLHVMLSVRRSCGPFVVGGLAWAMGASAQEDRTVMLASAWDAFNGQDTKKRSRSQPPA